MGNHILAGVRNLEYRISQVCSLLGVHLNQIPQGAIQIFKYSHCPIGFNFGIANEYNTFALVGIIVTPEIVGV